MDKAIKKSLILFLILALIYNVWYIFNVEKKYVLLVPQLFYLISIGFHKVNKNFKFVYFYMIIFYSFFLWIKISFIYEESVYFLIDTILNLVIILISILIVDWKEVFNLYFNNKKTTRDKLTLLFVFVMLLAFSYKFYDDYIWDKKIKENGIVINANVLYYNKVNNLHKTIIYEYDIKGIKYERKLGFSEKYFNKNIQKGDTIKIKVSKEDNSVSRILKELE